MTLFPLFLPGYSLTGMFRLLSPPLWSSYSKRDITVLPSQDCLSSSNTNPLKRALYGLKQAPKAWYSRIDNYLQGLGFTKSEADSNLYYIIVGGQPLILVLYVDDMFLTGSEKVIVECKRDLALEYKMKDLGLMHYFLGLQ
jgi:hypothetical protein